MHITYHKELPIPQHSTHLPSVPLYVYDVDPEIIQEHKLYGVTCQVMCNRYFIFLYLSNGDRIDIRRVE
jgi:hypothetical protein